ncbi:MAG: 23S rRNA (uracil(1939)-C(5))-methyltransferase RlmD [Deltaproteobacteria bacterium HGW-Deltaproteobacteria-4]|nr:MAG: 23S rRNA (uracil(1939)-C(5))-methyltransferase RlmD [Deltaproteobacteria bacterium HGW-Deltaproteobacteria-4]
MRLDADGVGIARHDGKDFIVAGAYPGEKVTATIEAKGQFRLVGRLRRVIKAHPHRIAKRCDSLTSCQGCPLLCLDEAAQFEIKQIRIRSAFNQYPQLKGVEIAPIWSAPEPFGYRSNAKLVFGRKRGMVQLGLYRRGTHDVVDLAGCPLHHPLINRIASVVREEVEKQEIYIYNAEKGRGLLRYLLIRVSPSRNKAMVTFVVAERDLKQLPHLAKSLQKRVPEVVSVQQNVNATTGNIIVGRDTQRLAGVTDLLDQVGDIRLQLAPASFFQVNHAQAARIYQLVRDWARLQASETAVDLYCGIGGIALHLARDAGRVYGIETIEEAVKNARANALLNDLRNCIFIAGDAEEVVEDLCNEIQRAEVVVLNPPRSGCQPQVLKAAASLQPRTLIYVSCNPETLARDLSLLHPLGYAADAVQPVDMFPQTAHIETVVRLVPITL